MKFLSRRHPAAIRDAKKFVEKMGCRWQENTEYPKLAHDVSAFMDPYAMLGKVRVVHNAINPDAFYKELLEDDLRKVRALQFPKRVPRGIWLRTQHERTFYRLPVYVVAVCGSLTRTNT